MDNDTECEQLVLNFEPAALTTTLQKTSSNDISARRYHVSTILNRDDPSPIVGVPFVGLKNAISMVDVFISSGMCRSGFVTDMETGEVVYTTHMPVDDK